MTIWEAFLNTYLNNWFTLTGFFIAIAVGYCFTFYIRMNKPINQITKLFKMYKSQGIVKIRGIDVSNPKERIYLLTGDDKEIKVEINHFGKVKEV